MYWTNCDSREEAVYCAAFFEGGFNFSHVLGLTLALDSTAVDSSNQGLSEVIFRKRF